MKRLILMRHGAAAASAPQDALRPLTEQGRKRVLENARKLAAQQARPDLLLASPLLRAQQTAEIVARYLQIPYQTQDFLDGRLSAKGLLDMAFSHLQQTDTLMLVGHNPNIAIAGGILAGSYFFFEPGALMIFDVSNKQKPVLLFRSSP